MSITIKPGDIVHVDVGSARVWSTAEDAVNLGASNNDGPIARLPQGREALVISTIEIPGTNGCLLIMFDNVLGYVYSSRVTCITRT